MHTAKILVIGITDICCVSNILVVSPKKLTIYIIDSIGIHIKRSCSPSCPVVICNVHDCNLVINICYMHYNISKGMIL